MRMRPIEYNSEQLIAKAIELAKQTGSIQRLTVRAVAKSCGCSTQPIYNNFTNITQLKKEVIAEFLTETIYKTSFLEHPQEQLPTNGAAFSAYFFECFHQYPYKKLLLEDPECREAFYTEYVSSYCSQILEEPNENIRKIYYIFLLEQVLLDEYVKQFV